MPSSYLQRTQTAGNTKTFTMSAWLKRAGLGVEESVFCSNTATNHDQLRFQNTNIIRFFSYNGSFQCDLQTNRVFRDTNAWYHIVVTVDTTQATASNRVKMYINGVQETSFSTETYPSQNYDFPEFNNNSVNIEVGARAKIPEGYFDGSMAHVHWIDGTAYDASAFGLTDSASGIWKPKTSPSVTYGTNGFFLDFANSSDLGNDVSGNNNDLTLSGSGTQTLDTPSNVFATMNSLIKFSAGSVTYSNGNLSGSLGSVDASIPTTLGVSKGKYYWEVKWTANGDYDRPGIIPEDFNPDATPPAQGIGWNRLSTTNGMQILGSTASGSWGSAFNVGDIINFALDCDNKALYIGQNGTWRNSGDPTSGASKTGAVDYSGTSLDGKYLFPSFGKGGAGTTTWQFNFGNGYFGTTPVSTPESDSAGLGKFEYSVPTGYYALCTKNIADYG